MPEPVAESKNQRDSVIKDQNMLPIVHPWERYTSNHSQTIQQPTFPRFPTIRVPSSGVSGQSTTPHLSEAISNAPSVFATQTYSAALLPQAVVALLGSSRSSLVFPSQPYFDPTRLVLAPLNFANVDIARQRAGPS